MFELFENPFIIVCIEMMMLCIVSPIGTYYSGVGIRPHDALNAYDPLIKVMVLPYGINNFVTLAIIFLQMTVAMTGVTTEATDSSAEMIAEVSTAIAAAAALAATDETTATGASTEVGAAAADSSAETIAEVSTETGAMTGVVASTGRGEAMTGTDAMIAAAEAVAASTDLNVAEDTTEGRRKGIGKVKPFTELS